MNPKILSQNFKSNFFAGAAKGTAGRVSTRRADLAYSRKKKLSQNFDFLNSKF